MHLTTRRLFSLFLASILVAGLATSAVAHDTSAEIQRIQQFARHHEQQIHTRNGLLHLAIKPLSNNRNRRRELKQDYLDACGENVIEFFKVRRRGNLHHLLTRMGQTTVDRGREPVLKISDWYISTGRTDRLGVLVKLHPSELALLQELISRGSNEATALSAIGNFSVVGDYPSSTNCTTWVVKARIGDQRESLGQLLQIGDHHITANHWISSLIDGRSPRVLGVVLHNPQEAEFNAGVSFAPFLD